MSPPHPANIPSGHCHPHPDFANRAISNIASIRTDKPDRIVTPRPTNGTNGLKGNVSCLVNGGWRGFSRAIDLHHRDLPIMHRTDQRHGTSVEPMENSRMLERSVLAQFSCVTMAPRIVGTEFISVTPACAIASGCGRIKTAMQDPVAPEIRAGTGWMFKPPT